MLSKRNNAIHQGWLSRKNRSIQRIKKDRPQAVKGLIVLDNFILYTTDDGLSTVKLYAQGGTVW